MKSSTNSIIPSVRHLVYGGKIEAEIRTDMDIWLKYHLAFLFPSLALALYAAGTDNYCLARTRDLGVLALRAIREGFPELRSLGLPVTPSKLRVIEWLPESSVRVDVKPGDRLLAVRGSFYGQGFVTRGPNYEEALKHRSTNFSIWADFRSLFAPIGTSGQAYLCLYLGSRSMGQDFGSLKLVLLH